MQDGQITITIPANTIQSVMNMHGVTYRGALKTLALVLDDVLEHEPEVIDEKIDEIILDEISGDLDMNADDFQDGKGFLV